MIKTSSSTCYPFLVKLGVRVNINYALFVLSYLGTILSVCRNWCFCNSKWRKGTTHIQYSCLRLGCGQSSCLSLTSWITGVNYRKRFPITNHKWKFLLGYQQMELCILFLGFHITIVGIQSMIKICLPPKVQTMAWRGRAEWTGGIQESCHALGLQLLSLSAWDLLDLVTDGFDSR